MGPSDTVEGPSSSERAAAPVMDVRKTAKMTRTHLCMANTILAGPGTYRSSDLMQKSKPL